MSLYNNTNVLSLTDDDFILLKEPKIRSPLWNKGDQGYVICYVQWCPHCQNKVPLWSSLADKYNTDPNTNFIIMAIDIEADGPGLAREAGITGIPTLFHVKSDGSMKRIPAGKSSADTTDWSTQDLISRIPAKTSTKELAKTPVKTSVKTPVKTSVKTSTRSSQAGGKRYYL